MRNYWQKWQRFWFLPTDLFRLALFRWIFSFFLFIMYVVRLTEFKIFFSEEGLFTHGSATSYLPDFLKPSIYLFSASDSLNLFFYVVLLALIFLLFL
ncbi:MAG: hypothetical protein KDD40_07620, partial [Bdellovibrionales bacterium]|nr:hypothetical protein [Bdellovibrionales bacterium]